MNKYAIDFLVYKGHHRQSDQVRQKQLDSPDTFVGWTDADPGHQPRTRIDWKLVAWWLGGLVYCLYDAKR